MKKKEFNELPEVIDVLGINYILSSTEQFKLDEFEYTNGRVRGANAKSIAYFIKYSLDDWIYRLSEIKKLKYTITERRYILLMGEEEGSKYWTTISKKKKLSQTEQKYIDDLGEQGGKEKWKEINARRGMSVFKKEYWISKGLSIEEADLKVKNISKKGAVATNKLQVKMREDNYEEWAKKMPTTKHYWIAQGFSEEEALLKVAERQTTFSKEKCIEKYGEIEGLKRWEERQAKWIYSLMKSNSFSTIGYASAESMKYFEVAIKLLEKNKIKYRVGKKDNSEYRIYGNGRLNLYDFVIEDLKLCFEYNGEIFHPNPKWKIENPIRWDSWVHMGSKINAEEKYNFDQNKLNLMRENGFDVYEIWGEGDFDEQMNLMIDIINAKIKDF